MKILVCGHKGFVGSHLCKVLSSDFDVVGTDIEDLDITKEFDIKNFFTDNKFDVVILTAANKNVKFLEQNKETAFEINTKPVEYFLKYCSAKLIFLSSDYVFDGKMGKYTDIDNPCPTTIYGKTKAEAEKILQESDKDYVIVRTAAILGKGTPFFDWLYNEINTNQTVEMYANSYFSPTCISFLAETIRDIIWANLNKITLNVVQEKRLSRYDLALIFKKLLNSSSEIKEIQTEFKDLSLIQSDFVKNLNKQSLEEFLKREIENV